MQPALKFLFEIAYALEVEVKDLLTIVANVEAIFVKERRLNALKSNYGGLRIIEEELKSTYNKVP